MIKSIGNDNPRSGKRSHIILQRLHVMKVSCRLTAVNGPMRVSVSVHAQPSVVMNRATQAHGGVLTASVILFIVMYL